MKTAIFDLDGTLANTLEDLADATNYGLVKLGCPVHSYDEYRYFVGNGVKKLCFRALPSDKKEYEGKLLEYFNDYYSKHFLDKTVLYPGIKWLLEGLGSNGVNIAVATNKPQIFAKSIAAALLPDVKFIKVLGGIETRAKKPDPAIIEEILSEIDGTKNEVFMIGDSAVDIYTAKNAGIKSIGCLWGFRRRSELEEAGADHIVQTAEEIKNIVFA